MYTGNNIQKIIFPLEILFVILMLKLGIKLKKIKEKFEISRSTTILECLLLINFKMYSTLSNVTGLNFQTTFFVNDKIHYRNHYVQYYLHNIIFTISIQ